MYWASQQAARSTHGESWVTIDSKVASTEADDVVTYNTL